MSESEKPVTYVNTPISMRYDYSIGVGMRAFMRAIREGKLLGARCPDTGKVYIPPRLTSVETATPMSELVELADRGVV